MRSVSAPHGKDSSWHMNDKGDTSGFVFRAPAQTVQLSSASNTPCMEPQRGGWKAAVELKGGVVLASSD